MNNKAITMLEILLASIIFLISVSGVFVTLQAVRVPVINKQNQLAAAIFGKQVLEALYSQVNSSTYYNTSCPTNTDGTCSDFSLYPAIHEVGALPAGVTWPSSITVSNTCNGGAISPCLSYAVACSDGTTGNACVNNSNQSIARQVTLNINWPSLP